MKAMNQIRIDGLEIQIGPGCGREEGSEVSPESDGKSLGEFFNKYAFETRDVVADGTVVRILSNAAEKRPLVWDLKTLHVQWLGKTHPFTFDSVLANAVPPGEITTSGKFGPWNEKNPGMTPVSGNYTFMNADLSYFEGITGVLSSFGTYSGVLGKLDVYGRTRTPDFALALSQNPVRLETEFHATVDGTRGDTHLKAVRASIGGTTIVASGGIVGHEGQRTVDLLVEIAGGRLEDILPLAVRGRSPMTGVIDLSARLVVAPEDSDTLDKLSLNGHFIVNAARFRIPEMQQKMERLSGRARGDIASENTGVSVLSKMEGGFIIRNGVLQLSDFSFSIPGGTVVLDGQYLLREDQLYLKGHLLMEARLSETASGFKSLVLKLVDPFFRANGKTDIPVRITGSKDKPSFKFLL